MHISRLAVTPVKGFALHEPDSVLLDASGAVGDRDFFLVDDADKLVSITKTGAWVGLRADWDPASGGLAIRGAGGEHWAGDVVDGAPVVADHFGIREIAGHVVEGPWTEPLSELADRPVRLVRAAERGGGSDIHPVTFLGDATVGDFARAAGLEALDPRRFRMLIGFAGGEPYAEEAWAGRVVAVGEAEIEVGGPVPRCAATTRHPDRGDRDVPVVKHLKDIRGFAEGELGRGLMFGVYGRVTRPGRVCVGDELHLR